MQTITQHNIRFAMVRKKSLGLCCEWKFFLISFGIAIEKKEKLFCCVILGVSLPLKPYQIYISMALKNFISQSIKSVRRVWDDAKMWSIDSNERNVIVQIWGSTMLQMSARVGESQINKIL